ncbi:hypothetical protein CsSME_00034524 [Camellia sinensis var. sinensis]
MARRKNAKRMATQRKAEADRSEPPPVAGVESSLPTLVEKTVQIDTAETKHIVVDQQDNQEAKHKGEKRSAEHEADSSENLTGKRPRIEESDLVVLFIIQPRIKNVPVASDASAVKDAAVALSVASSISLPVDRATFRVELDLLSIALAAQSAILAEVRIAEIGHRQHDVIEQIGFLTTEVKMKRATNGGWSKWKRTWVA